MGKDKNQQNMGNQQQKQHPGKENLNPGQQRPQQDNRNLKTPTGGHNMGGQGGQGQQKAPFIKKEEWNKDKNK